MTLESETHDPFAAGWPLWQPPPGLPEPAREVWLAGLGALARAHAEGGKAFEALVRQGLALQTQASQAAQEHIAEAAQAATQPWERISGLSGIFEDRVARALTHLGLPAAQDWAALQARVQMLESVLQDVLRLTAQPAAARPSAAKPSAKFAARSAAAKPDAGKYAARAKIPLPVRSSKKTRPPSSS